GLFKETENDSHDPLRQTRQGSRRTGFPALPWRTRQTHLRKRLEGSLGRLAQAPDDAGQRKPPEPGRRARPQIPGRADGKTLLRRRRGPGCRLRAADVLISRIGYAAPAYEKARSKRAFFIHESDRRQ